MASETCLECQTTVEEDQGRWLILDEAESEGFDWKFMCVQCAYGPGASEAWSEREYRTRL